MSNILHLDKVEAALKCNVCGNTCDLLVLCNTENETRFLEGLMSLQLDSAVNEVEDKNHVVMCMFHEYKHTVGNKLYTDKAFRNFITNMKVQ